MGLRLANKSRRRKAKGPKRGARRKATRRALRFGFRLPRIEWRPRRFAVMASALVLLVGMVLVIASAPGWGRGEERFLLSRFEVRGNAVLTRDEVLDISGAEMGSNLLNVGISALEEAVAASPRVDRAQAIRVLPDRVIVTLDERRPVALVASPTHGVLEVTREGAVLPPAVRTPFVDLPVVTGAVGEVEPGIETLSDELRAALDVLRRARDVSEGLWNEISEIRIAPGSGLVIHTVADGAEIRVGSGALGSRDLERLWRVLEDVRWKGGEVRSIDLRFRNQVIVRLT